MLLMYDFKSRSSASGRRAGSARHLYRAADESAKPKYYTMEMLPYPSGDLHVGHAKNYTLGDVVARMMRMLGYNVLHPMGWDAFGLPAENAAIARGIDPAVWTTENILNMRRQIRLMGTSYDWSREIATCEPEYYRWNQWLFLRLFENGLAYKREAPVNWCPHDQTVLANEQVIDGRCWRCDHLVERRNLSQWFLRITAYADRLLDDLGEPDRLARAHAHDAAQLDRPQRRRERRFRRRRTRRKHRRLHDARRHALRRDVLSDRARAPAGRTAQTQRFRTSGRQQSTHFVESLKSKSELERTSLMEKQGVFTGAYAINPLSRERVPIWVTNYVLAEYGSGAVMGVPAHDERDFEFRQEARAADRRGHRSAQRRVERRRSTRRTSRTDA